MHGGIAQGVGQALMERAVYDEDGQLLTASLMDYCLPRADDLPNFAFETRNIPSTTNPLGLKGAGEAGSIGSTPAVMNAVGDALWRAYGVDHIDMPATPLAVFKAIRGRRRGAEPVLRGVPRLKQVVLGRRRPGGGPSLADRMRSSRGPSSSSGISVLRGALSNERRYRNPLSRYPGSINRPEVPIAAPRIPRRALTNEQASGSALAPVRAATGASGRRGNSSGMASRRSRTPAATDNSNSPACRTEARLKARRRRLGHNIESATAAPNANPSLIARPYFSVGGSAGAYATAQVLAFPAANFPNITR